MLYDLLAHLQQNQLLTFSDDQLHPDDLNALANHPKRQLIQKISRYQRRKILAEAIEQPEHTLCFSHTEFGKPILDSHAQLSFNQSHSQSMYVLAWSHDLQHIGIDIEDKNRGMRVEALAKHSLTALEYERFRQAADQQLYWLKLWTIKEAVLKASGLGIRLNLNELETHCLDMQQADGVVTHPKIGDWSYACYALPDHMLCVSWPSKDAQQNVKIIFSEIS
jgi:4'-phosphopantetheinyl transferase